MPLREKIKNIKGILFDLDGTLLETEDIQKKGFEQTLAFYNINLNNFNYSKIIGRGMTEIEKIIITKYNLDINEGELKEKRKEIILNLFTQEKIPYTHFAIEALKYLSKKFPMGICSAGEKEEIYLKLKTNNLLKYFNFYISSEDVEKSKPNPDIYLKGIKTIGLKPKECLSFEDTFAGATAAKKAGTICFITPNKYEKEIKDFSFTDKTLESLEEGINIIKKYVN